MRTSEKSIEPTTHAGRTLTALDVTSVALTIAENEGSGDSEGRKGSNSEETSEHYVGWKG